MAPDAGVPAGSTGATAKVEGVYQELILDHYRRPRNRGTLERPTTSVSHRNPLCGDEIELTLDVRNDRVTDARFTARGCSLSLAAASMLTEIAKGRTRPELEATHRVFAAMLTGDAAAAADPMLGDLHAFRGMSRVPGRARCALLPFEALERALSGQTQEDGDSQPSG